MHPQIEKVLKREKGMNSEATYAKRKSTLGRYDDWLDEQGLEPAEVTPADIEDFLLDLKADGYAPKTIAGYYESVRALYNYLSGIAGVLEDHPMEDLKKGDYTKGGARKHEESDISYVSPEEKEQMVEHVPDPKLRNELLIRLLFQTGMRKGEAANLKLDDLDREAREIEVWSPKTKETRTVYYQPSLDFLLDQWIDGGYRDASAAPDSDYLFVTSRAERLTGGRIGELVKEAAQNAGINEVLYVDQRGNEQWRVTTHALRHGFAVNALKCGIDIRRLQKLLGHSDIGTTQKYLQVIDEDVKAAYRKFDPQGPGDEQEGAA